MQNNKDKLPPEVERYLALCERAYERMVEEGRWPWTDDPDSTESGDLVESGDNSQDI